MNRHLNLPDTNQNAWELACIQLAGFASLPIFATSILLFQKYQFTSTLVSLVIGNLILALIRYPMIVMSDKSRSSTLDISKNYLGPFGFYIVAFVLLASTLAWYETQTTLATNSLFFLIGSNFNNNYLTYLQICILIGLASTLLCMEGIVIIKKLAVYSFPILFVLSILAVCLAPIPSIDWSFGNFTLAGIPLIIATNLGVTADLPTFFRHSHSRKESIKALILIQIFSLVLSIIGVFLAKIIEPWFGTNIAHSTLGLRCVLIGLIFISSVNANVANIYSASVGWEIIAPILAGRKEWLILGIGLTLISVMLINVFSLENLLAITESSLINLTIIFIAAYIIEKIFAKRFKIKTMYGYLSAWLIASALTFVNSHTLFSTKISSMWISCLSVFLTLAIYFIFKRVFKLFLNN